MRKLGEVIGQLKMPEFPDDWENERLIRQNAQKERQRQLLVDDLFQRSGVLPVHAKATVSAEIFDLITAGRGLYITGGVGSGKTWLASGIVLEACRRGIEAKIVVSTELLMMIQETFGSNSTLGLIRSYASIPVLAIDDLGKEYASEWALARLWDIVNFRWGKHLPLVVTTQFSDFELLARWKNDQTGKAIISRLHEICVLVHTGNTDRRSQSK
jgi:DNA replication protein DnaC/primosomal protein DnaI